MPRPASPSDAPARPLGEAPARLGADPQDAPPLGPNRVLDLDDFRHPRLRAAIRELFPHELVRFGEDFPDGVEYRKYWEVAMTALALEDSGVLGEEAEVLGIAAGNEPTIFWLTTRAGRVFATDLYLAPGDWGEFANPAMLGDPGSQWPWRWNRRRLVVQHMDALELQYEDESFDAIFSSSSIEHLGGLEEVGRAIDEAYRVLRPGGVIALSTEFRLAGPSPGLPGCLMLDAREIREHIVGDRGWTPLSHLEQPAGGRVAESAVAAEEQMEDLTAHFGRWKLYLLHELRFSRYPQVALRLGEHVWTSVHLALRKDPPERTGRGTATASEG